MSTEPQLAEDPRTTLQKMRRIQLRRFLTSHNIPHEESSTHRTLMSLAQDNGLSGLEVPRNPQDTRPPLLITPDFEGMKMPDLRRACSERNIKFNPKDTADVLKEKLRGHHAA